MNEQRKALGRREKERMNERNGEGEGMNGRKNKRMNGRKKEQMKGRTSKIGNKIMKELMGENDQRKETTKEGKKERE